ncbi:MAG: Stealth CR1 domain-containing protein [Clostridia bacterium]|nr:Stealth CR1 domain-containing protein [Clostridia bacterium]
MKDDKIDIVIAWVDGNDSDWIKEKNKYSDNPEYVDGINESKFRDWGIFKYVFRGIEKNMPWVNHIYLVTCGQTPEWLDTSNEKISVVKHEEFIPQKYLPTFSSHPIELNFHRIQGLSEKFIYFNDDMFAINSLKPEDFFYNEKPCDSAVLNVHCVQNSSAIYSICVNDVAVINDHCNLKSQLKQNFNKWFNWKYGIKNNIQNIIFSNCPRFPGFKQFHIPTPLLKSMYKELWDKEYEILNETSENKFRSKHDVNQWVIRDYQLATGNFNPSKRYKLGTLIDFDKNEITEELEKCKKIILGNSYKLVCINDSDNIPNVEHVKNEVNNYLNNKFPQKSKFER